MVFRHRSIPVALLAGFALLGLGASARAATYVLDAIADTYVDEGAPVVANGSQGRLDAIGGAGDRRIPLLRFDLSAIPAGEFVTSATLQMHVLDDGDSQGGPGAPHRIFGVGSDWSEANATWALMSTEIDSSRTWATFTPDTDESADVAVIITPLARAWHAGVSNRGLSIVSESGDRSRFSSREASNVADRPTLVIETSASSGLWTVSVAKTSSASTVAEGDTLTFSISASNDGAGPVTPLLIYDPLPTGLTWVTNGQTSGTYDSASGLWTIPFLGGGQVAQLNVVAVADSGTAGRTLQNWAWYENLSGLDNDISDNADSAAVVVTAPGADIAVDIDADETNPQEGDDVQLSVQVENSGPNDATLLDVAVPLPAGLAFVASAASAGSYSSVTGLWSLPGLPVDGVESLTLDVSVSPGAAGSDLVVPAYVDAAAPGDPVAANDSTAVVLTVQSADLQLSASVDDPSPAPGDAVTFQLIVTNAGPSPAAAIEIGTALDAGLTRNSSAASAGTFSPATGVWSLPALAAGASDTLTVGASVQAGTGGQTLNWTTQIDASDTPDPVGGNDAASASVSVQSAQLQLLKTVDLSRPAEGDTVSYRLSLTNVGSVDAFTVAVTDTIPAGLTLVSATPSQGTFTEGTGRWNVGLMPEAGTAATLDLVATVDPGTAGQVLWNRGQVVSSNPPVADFSAATDSVAVTVQSADLKITKVASIETPDEGDGVIFTVTVENLGPDDAAGVTVLDPLPAGLTFGFATESAGAYDDASGIWSVGDLAVGEVETLAIQTTVDAGTGGTVLTNTATLGGSDPVDPVPGNDSMSVDLDVQAADLSLTKSVNKPNPLVGATITYTVQVANAGPDPATNVAVADTIPSGLLFQSSTATHGTYDPGTSSWSLGTLAPSDTASLSLVAVVEAGAAGTTLTNRALVSAVDTADPAPGNEADSVDVVVQSVLPVDVADLAVVLAVDDGTPGVGDSIRFELVLTNLGPDAATGVEISLPLPVGLSFSAAAPTSGGYDAGTGVWTVGSVGLAAPDTLLVDAVVDAGEAGRTLTATAAVSSLLESDPVPANSSDTETITVRNADLGVTSVVNDGAPDAGDPITWTVTVVNTGPDPTTGVIVDAGLPAGLSLSGSGADRGAWDGSTWTIGGLAAPDTATLVVDAIVDAGTGGATIPLVAAVSASDEGDSLSTNDTDSTAVTVTLADVAVRVESDDPTPAEGGPVTCSVTLTNLGPDPVTGLAADAPLPAGLTLQSAAPGQGTYDAGSGRWTVGTVAVGDSVRLDLAATVDAGTNGTSLTFTATRSAADPEDPTAGNDVDSVSLNVPLLDGIRVSLAQTPRAASPGRTGVGLATVGIVKTDAGDVNLTSISFRNVSIGAGTPAQLDSNFGKATLYRDNGNGAFEPLLDTPLADATMSAGVLTFNGLSVPTPSGGAYALHVGGGPSLGARDSDILDLRIDSPSDLTFDVPAAVVSRFPAEDEGGITVNGLVAAQIQVRPLPSTKATVGTSLPVLDATLPANGYEPDTLQEIHLTNSGTAQIGSDLDVRIWVDGGDSLMDGGAGDDVLLGTLSGGGASGSLTGLAQAVPTSGLRIFGEALIAGDAVVGRTFALRIAQDGLVMASDNDGPLFAATGASASFTIASAPTPVEISATPQEGGTILPGAAAGRVFEFRVINQGTETETIRSIRLTNRTTGSAGSTQADRDADWSELSLFRDRAAELSGIGRSAATFADGAVTFSGLAESIAPGDSATFQVYGGAALVARDGDVLDLRIDDEGDVAFARAVAISGSFPLDPSGAFPVDGLAKAQVAVGSVDPSLLTGESRRVALDVILPGNGYEDDTLQRLDVVNLGTAEAGGDITRVEAWIDDGDGTLDPFLDPRLGELTDTGSRWERTGLALPLPATTGQRVFVTVDIAEAAVAGRTVQLALPGPPYVGIGVASDNDGPLDGNVASSAQTISTVDRVSVTPVTEGPSHANPGQGDVSLLVLALENNYSTTRSLNGLTVTNATAGTGTPSQLDAEIQALTLWADDGDGLFQGEGIDQKLGTTFFSSGSADFDGFSAPIAADATRRFWVRAEVSLSAAADGDTLGVFVASAGDVRFAEATEMAASFPLDSGARPVIDGFVSSQVVNHGAAGVTLGADDGPFVALDVSVPGNGYRTDTLESVDVVNLGSAGPADLADLQLWRDGGDGQFDGGLGDDANLGSFTFLGGRWQLPGLGEVISPGSVRFFVSITASSVPSDSATVRLAIPVDGIRMTSENDGPLDAPVANSEALVLSTAVLIASLELSPAASTVGGAVTVTLRVRNDHPSEALIDVAPSTLTPSGVGQLSALSGPVPATRTLALGEEGTFTWTYEAMSSGEVRLSGGVSGTAEIAGTPHQSLAATSNAHEIFVEAQDLDVFAVESMPFSISRGQAGVVPLSLTFENPAGVGGSDVSLLGLRVRLEDESGAGVVPADLLSRVVINEGTVVYLDKSALETSGDQLDLTLAQPVTISSSGAASSATLAIALDISDSTSVPSFRLIIDDPTWIVAQDATSGGPVNVALVDPPAFPVSSGLARIVSEATQVDVTEAPLPDRAVGQGQDDVPALAVTLDNPDLYGLAADARVLQFELELVDAAGQVIAEPDLWIDGIRVVGPVQTHASRSVSASDGAALAVSLAPLVSIPVNTPVPLVVYVDIDGTAPVGAFRVRLRDAGTFQARDANTGATLPAVYATTPLHGPQLSVQTPAGAAVVTAVPRVPAELPVGSADVPVLDLTVTHPGPAGAGPIRIDGLVLQSRDGANLPVIASSVLDAARVRVDGAVVGEIAVATGEDEILIPLSDVTLDPMTSTVVQVFLDVEVSAPGILYQITVASDGIIAADANLATPVVVSAGGGGEFPLSSGVTQLRSPARDLIVGLQDLMPPVLAADSRPVPAAALAMTNPAAPTSGDIVMTSFRIVASAPDGGPQDIGAAVAEVSLWQGDVLWASSGPIDPTAASAPLPGVDSLRIAPEETVELRLEMTCREGTSAEGVRLGLAQADVGVVQPGNPLLSISVLAADGSTFPLWTSSGNFSGATLEESYSNFPNPFAAGREATTVAFYLDGPGRVSLKIHTLRGELVRDLLTNTPREVGLHQDVTWDGRNGRGHVVRNGVYLAEISVTFDDGRSERLLRKVAVVR